MKYHKIPKVDKAICTAEQMIAYNMAFRAEISFGDKFRALPTGWAKAEACHDIARYELRNYRNAYDYNPGKYDEDAIMSALRAGLADYLTSPFIASDYKTIGEAFPAYYLK